MTCEQCNGLLPDYSGKGRRTRKFCSKECREASRKPYLARWYQDHRDERLQAERDRKRNAKATPEGHVASLVVEARCRAARSGVVFDVTAGDLPAPTVCPVLGFPLVYGPRGKRGGATDDSPSIDRIDPSRGYVKGNVWVISKRANTIKSNATAAELRAVADAVEERLHVQEV